MANYDEEIEVPLGSVFKDRPPRQAGYVTYVNGSVDTNVAGDYILEYTLIKEDPFDSISETKKVTVTDSTGTFDTREPEILLNGSHVVTIPEGTAWIDPGAEAFTKETFESLEVKIALPVDEGSWAYQQPGSYSVVYYAETSGGRVAVAVRTVFIVAVSATASLNGCSKIYIEYPISGEAISYVGQNYTGSGSGIVIDAGYSVSGSNYTVEIGVEPEGGEIYIVSEDNVFFTADPAETKTYKIFYKVTTQEGYERTSIREVVMMKQNETDTTVLSGLEFQKNSADGCADRDPIVTEDDLLKDDLEKYGDSVFDDPVLNGTPSDAPNPQTNNALAFLCAGTTAFSGGLFPSTWSSNPGKIPNEIVENWYAPGSTRSAFDSFFSVLNGAYMPGENEKTFWTGKGTYLIWRLHKIHSETKVTYSYGYGLGSAPILYSTWEPYYENGTRVGDIFYGFYGAHIFLAEEGWSASLSKESITFKEFMGERTYRGLHPYSFTRVTSELKAMHVAKISSPNIPGEFVFQDPNKQILSSGTVYHSLPIFRGIDEKIARGGIGTADEDMISLGWRSLGGVTDVSKYCDYTVQEKLPIFCQTPRDPYTHSSVSTNWNFIYLGGDIPGNIAEITWTDNPYQDVASSSQYYYTSGSKISGGDYLKTHAQWHLYDIYPDKLVYRNTATGDLRDLVADPDRPGYSKFEGYRATYSWNRWVGPARIHSNQNFAATYKEKWITNYDDGERIEDTAAYSDSDLASLDGVFAGQKYYSSLTPVSDRYVSVSDGQRLSNWFNALESRIYNYYYPFHSATIVRPTVHEIIEPCDQVQLPLYCNTTFDKFLGYDSSGVYGYNPYSYDYETNRAGPVPGVIVELTWTDNPYFGQGFPTASLHRSNLIHLNEFSVRHVWNLVQIRADRCTYMLADNSAEVRDMVTDPSDPTKTLFEGFAGNYSFNHAHAPAIFEPGGFSSGSSGMKYMTNFDSGDRIPETSLPSGLDSSLTYYNSLAFGGYAQDSSSNSWVDPTGSKRTYTKWHPQSAGLSTGTWELIGDPVEPC